MSTREPMKELPVPPERLAEAGVWIARLHGGARTPAMEAGFRQWLQASPMNARAFELSTEVWEESQNLRRVVPFAASAPAPKKKRFPVSFGLAAAAATVAAVAVGVILQQRAGVSTAVGEQRLLTLEDGTRVFLNTATQVVVRYDKHQRKVELKTGEALFDVAKRTGWPFVVEAGNRQISALGTSFIVRRDEQQLAVTLVEGKVKVTPIDVLEDERLSERIASVNADAEAQQRKQRLHVAQDLAEEFTLTPGQRLTFAGDNAGALDTLSLDKATAWRRGQVLLDDTPLARAISEMNRYSAVKLVVEHPETEALLINGLFQVGDSASFAQAVAQTYGLTVIERHNQIVLAGVPARMKHAPL